MTSIDFGKELHAQPLDAIAPDALSNRVTLLRNIICNERFRKRSHRQLGMIHMPPNGLSILNGDDRTEKSVRLSRQRAQLQSNISTRLVEHCPVLKYQRLITAQHNIARP